ncbi:hypothetical protein COO60DRAFT_1524827, partial [Scenedesmus sp. NREL 46B-D3]
MYMFAPSNHAPRQALAAAAERHSRPICKSVRCFAKGNQKNEGMYFEYVPVNNHKEPSAEEQQKQAKKEQQQFGWASAARSSVQQYRKTVSSKRPKPPNKPRQQQPGTTANAGSAQQPPLQLQTAQALPSHSAGAEATLAAEAGSALAATP